MHSDSEARFWAKVKRAQDNECWEWTGAKRGSRSKRGCFWDGARNVDAARWIWQNSNGRPIPDGHVVMHTCDNGLCVNPRHLRTGTQSENVADMWRKGRANIDAIRIGAAKGRASIVARPEVRARGAAHGIHKRSVKGEANPLSSLTETAVREIRELAGSLPQRAIAERYGVTQAGVWRIIHRKSWTHI